jgi:hypothetical protein
MSVVVSRTPCAASHGRVDRGVDVAAKLRWIHVGKAGPTPHELVEGDRRGSERDELCDRLAGTRDRQLFAALCSLDDRTAVIAQIADRNLSHSWQSITRDTHRVRTSVVFQGCMH